MPAPATPPDPLSLPTPEAVLTHVRWHEAEANRLRRLHKLVVAMADVAAADLPAGPEGDANA